MESPKPILWIQSSVDAFTHESMIELQNLLQQDYWVLWTLSTEKDIQLKVLNGEDLTDEERSLMLNHIQK